MTNWYDCTGFQRDCLHAIAVFERRDRHPFGLALKRWLDERYDEPINHSRLYQNLQRLADMDLVDRKPTDGRETHYRLTDTGRRMLATHARLLTSSCERSWLTADRSGGTIRGP